MTAEERRSALLTEAEAVGDLHAKLLAYAIRAIEDLREDLKRREARRLEAAGKIPAGRGGGSADRPRASVSGPCFPNYGRSKGQPIEDASMGDLEYYANGARRTLADPNKARFHAAERELLRAIQSEMDRQGGADVERDEPPPPRSDPTPSDFGPGDDDIPF